MRESVDDMHGHVTQEKALARGDNDAGAVLLTPGRWESEATDFL